MSMRFITTVTGTISGSCSGLRSSLVGVAVGLQDAIVGDLETVPAIGFLLSDLFSDREWVHFSDKSLLHTHARGGQVEPLLDSNANLDYVKPYSLAFELLA